jgi:DNA-3-methyladenine glycosylase II
MNRLISEHGPYPIAHWEYHPFHTLVISIISQQLSARAADTIEKLIAAIVLPPFQAAELLSVSAESLASAGLSRPKVRYIHEWLSVYPMAGCHLPISNQKRMRI